MNEKLTIHRALVELKLIDDKISSRIQNLNPIAIVQKERKVLGFYTSEEFTNNANSSYQSISDLVQRKMDLKCKIVQSNARTMVKVGDIEMTVADAISRRDIIQLKRQLLGHLKKCLDNASASFINENNKVNKHAFSLAEAALGKDNVKVNDKDYQAITEPFLDKNLWHLVDPLKIQEKIQELEDEIDTFEANIDAVLSESNATMIIDLSGSNDTNTLEK